MALYLDGPDFGEACPAWGAVPECNTDSPLPTGKPGGINEPPLRFEFSSLH